MKRWRKYICNRSVTQVRLKENNYQDNRDSDEGEVVAWMDTMPDRTSHHHSPSADIPKKHEKKSFDLL
jgi:hypothetical protein